MSKPRKPGRLKGKKGSSVYAGFDDTNQCFIYIGGSYYASGAQIHLNVREALALAEWLGKVSKWAQSRKDKSK